MRGAFTALILLLPGIAAADGYFTLSGHGGPIMDIEVEAETGRIATASFDNSVGLWSGGTPLWLDGHEAAVNAVRFLPDGSIISGGDDFRVLHWPRGKTTPVELFRHAGKLMDLAVSPDGRRIASASWDGTIALGGLDLPFRQLKGHKGAVNDVLFSADGREIFSGAADGTLRVWDADSGKELRQIVRNGFGINNLARPPDGSWLAYGTVDGVVKIIDPDSGDEIADFTLDRRPILALAYDPAQQQLAIGDGDGYIMIVDTTHWTIRRDFRATLKGPIWALAFSPDGTNIHAGGLDSTLHSWPVATLSDQKPISAGSTSAHRDPGEMSNGERQFAQSCAICHSLTPGSERRAGPTLKGLFGRRAGTVPDYAYSDALNGSNIIWTEETVKDLFDVGPEHYIPGTKMPMQRIAAAQDREDLISYLKTATRP